MTSWLFAPPAMRRLLPDQRRRAAPWIVGLMTFVSLVVGAAGVSVIAGVAELRGAAADRWSLQVTGPAAERAEAIALLRRAPGVAAVAPVPETEVRETLRRWLGPAADSRDLPVPLLADVTLKPGTDGAALGRSLAGTAPTARLTAYAEDLRPLVGTLRGLAALAIGLLLVLAGALAAAVTLAARATLDGNRATLDVLHGIGATDAQLLGLVQRRIAIDAFVGSLAGAAAAAVVLVGALIPARGLLPGWSHAATLPLGGLALLALLPLVQASLATLVARRALHRAMAETL